MRNLETKPSEKIGANNIWRCGVKMPAFIWTHAWSDAIREVDPARQMIPAGLALNECTNRLSQLGLLPTCEEHESLRTALEDLKVMAHLNRKYGTQSQKSKGLIF